MAKKFIGSLKFKVLSVILTIVILYHFDWEDTGILGMFLLAFVHWFLIRIGLALVVFAFFAIIERRD